MNIYSNEYLNHCLLFSFPPKLPNTKFPEFVPTENSLYRLYFMACKYK